MREVGVGKAEGERIDGADPMVAWQWHVCACADAMLFLSWPLFQALDSLYCSHYYHLSLYPLVLSCNLPLY